MIHLNRRNPVYTVLALLAVLALGLAACTPPATQAPSATPPPQPTTPPQATAEPTAVPTVAPTNTPEPVELHFAWWGSQSRHDRTIKVIEMFMAQHPNITITYEFASFNDYWSLLAPKAAAGELPDLIQQDYAYFKQYVSDGWIMPLDPFVEDGTINLKDAPKDAVDGGRVDGKLYALSLGTNTQSFVIDVDLFNQAGVALPKEGWTWKDFEDTNKAIHDKLGIFGTGGGLENPQIINALYLSLGQGLYSDDGKAFGFTDDQPLIDYFKMMKRMQDEKSLVSRAELVANPATLEKNALVTKEAALYFAHTNQLVALWKAAGADRNLQMVPVPLAVGAKQPANYLKPSMFFSISANSKHPKEAAMFIDFFTNSVEANEVLLAERGVPISTAVQNALKPKLDKVQLATFDFVATVKVSPIRPPDPAKHNEIQTNIYGPQVIDAIMYGQSSVEDAVALFRKEATAILAGS